MALNAIFNKPQGWAFGPHSSENEQTKLFYKLPESTFKMNVMNVLGCIPVLSIIAGIYHRCVASKWEKSLLGQQSQLGVKKAKVEQYIFALRARSYLEFSQVGCIAVLVADILGAFGRFAPCCQPNR